MSYKGDSHYHAISESFQKKNIIKFNLIKGEKINN